MAAETIEFRLGTLLGFTRPDLRMMRQDWGALTIIDGPEEAQLIDGTITECWTCWSTGTRSRMILSTEWLRTWCEEL